MAEAERAGEGGTAAPEKVPFGIGGQLVRNVRDSLEAGDADRLAALFGPLHYADQADLLEQLDPGARSDLLRAVSQLLDPEALTELDEDVRDSVMEELGTRHVVEALAELDTDDAVGLIQDMDEDRQREILDAVPAEERAILEQGLAYPEESAGRLMQREFVAVPGFWTVGEFIDYLRNTDPEKLPEDFYDLFVVDPKHRPIGTVPLSRVLRTHRPVPVQEIMDSEEEFATVPATMDQEEVARVFRDKDLVSAPVVDEDGRLVGVVTVDDVVDVIHEEAEEDMMRLARVGETDLHAGILGTASRRVRWLLVTLVNTILAALVISQFQATIEQMAVVAVLMPIVAAMGGNAGMQVVTVTVRGLAMREFTMSNAWRIIRKEAVVGALNGIVFAIIMGTVAALWFDFPMLGAVLAAAMVFNMIWAAVAGTLIPFGLSRMGADPAVSAGPFLTTTTDVLGFLVFLGLATAVLL